MWSLGLLIAFLSLHVCSPEVVLIDAYPEVMFYLAVTGNYEEPLYMETKAYCASHGFLNHRLMIKRDWEELPVYNETESFLTDGNKSYVTEIFPGFVTYNKFAMTREAAESGLWTNYTFRLSQTAKVNTTEYSANLTERSRRTHNANVYYKSNLLWLEQTGLIEIKTLTRIQDRLFERFNEIRSGDYHVFIAGLDKLFKKSRLSPDLFTPETEAYVQANKPTVSHANAYRFAATFVVKGCAEQPKNSVNNRIIIAMEGDLDYAIVHNKLLAEEDF